MAKTKKIWRKMWYEKVSFLGVYLILIVSFLACSIGGALWFMDGRESPIYTVTDLKWLLDVPDNEKQICMDWAYGVGWEWWLTGDMDDRWNHRHQSLFRIDGTDSVHESQKRISKYWNKNMRIVVGCDGTNDEVHIQHAIDALPSWGGE